MRKRIPRRHFRNSETILVVGNCFLKIGKEKKNLSSHWYNKNHRIDEHYEQTRILDGYGMVDFEIYGIWLFTSVFIVPNVPVQVIAVRQIIWILILFTVRLTLFVVSSI
jgi:hypothetical protein